MLRKTYISLIVLITACVIPLSGEASKFEPEQAAGTIAPYIDPQTIVVVRVDVSKIDVDATVGQIVEVASAVLVGRDKETVTRMAEQWRQNYQKRRSDFLQAGGREVYAVFSLADFPRFFTVTPLTKNADVKTLMNLIDLTRKDFDIGAFEQLRQNDVLISGRKEVISRLKDLRVDSRPDLALAFTEAGASAVQILYLPNPDSRRVINELLPALLPRVGDTPVAINSPLWAALGVDLPPKMGLNLSVQSINPDSARIMQVLILGTYQFLRQNPQVEKMSLNLDPLLTTLTPKVVNDRVTLSLDHDRMPCLLTDQLVPVLKQAQAFAHRVRCRSNLSSIGKAICLYQNDHQDNNPPNLKILIKEADLPGQILLCPASGEEYVYRGVDLTCSASSKMILAYDKLEYHGGKGRSVLFADVHVEFLTEPEFQKAIELDNELRRKLQLPEKPSD